MQNYSDKFQHRIHSQQDGFYTTTSVRIVKK